MDLKNIYSKKNNIFQSPIWAEFQKTVGREPIEIDKAFFYKEKLIRDKFFLYCPKTINSKQLTINKVNETVGDKSIVFVRIEPNQSTVSSKQLTGLKKVGKNSILSQQYSPMQTLVLDLIKSEEELLSNMKSKHRYNIRLAEKKGIVVKKGISKKDVDIFYQLSQEVSKRDNTFNMHPKAYYEKMVEILGKNGNLQIFTAEYKGKPLSSLIILFYNDTAIYLHGASSNENREFMPNHLAQWEAIKEAKKRGCKYYDFWGASFRQKTIDRKQLAEEGGDNLIVDENHSWAGITKFKLGFVKLGITGEMIEFPGAYDLSINKFWYNGLSVLNRFRKLVKR